MGEASNRVSFGVAPYYACRMNAYGLPARITYAVVALPAVGTAGFYSAMQLLPRLALLFGGHDAALNDSQTFMASIALASLLALTAALLGLTLPWRRRRKRRGRRVRAVVSTVVLFAASLSFAGQGHALVLDLAVVLWLAYILTYTLVRYGVRDQPRRSSRSGSQSTGGSAQA